MLIFELPGRKQSLIFTGSVLSFLEQYRQIGSGQAESGGQLFAKVLPKIVIVTAATGPHRKDFRHRFSFFPNKKRLRAEIQEFFKKGLHYVGDWHTHPQTLPKPSYTDLRSVKEQRFTQSMHELEHFVLVVVGKSDSSEGIWVGLINHIQQQSI